MTGFNAPDSRDNSLSSAPPEKGKAPQRKTRQGGTAKNASSSLSATNKRTADQTFRDTPIEIITDSHLQNEVASLERQVLEAKETALQKQLQTLNAANPTPSTEGPTANTTEARTSNFGLFYEHEGEESHFVPLMREYRSLDIQYSRDIKKNKFKPENIMKLSISMSWTREVSKSLKIGSNGLVIEAKEEDCTIADAKGIILLL